MEFSDCHIRNGAKRPKTMPLCEPHNQKNNISNALRPTLHALCSMPQAPSSKLQALRPYLKYLSTASTRNIKLVDPPPITYSVCCQK